MRPKFVLLIMLLAVGVLGLMVMLKRNQGGQGGAQDAAGPASVTNVEATALPGVEAASVTNVLSSQEKPLVSSATAGQAQPIATNSPIVQPAVVASIVATTPEQDHQAAIEKDMNKLNEALIDGGSDPKLVQAVRERLLHPDAEVRKTAAETIMHLNDREAIPALKEALAKIEDPREKVVMMDAIEYLQTPDGDPQFTTDTPPAGEPPAGATNRVQKPTVRQPRAVKR
jgi:HEAT repeats